MKFANLNRKRTMPNVDTSNFEFKKLQSYVGKTIKVEGFFFTDGKYGKQVVILSGDNLINMPSWSVKDFETIEKDDNLLSDLLNGKCGLTNISKKTTPQGDTTVYEFFDM